MNQIKSMIRNTPFFIPLKWVAALLGLSTFPLPFSHTLAAEPLLDRATARIGRAPNPERRTDEFYSYFSEIWADGYENGLAQQYDAYLPHILKINDLPFLDIGCGAGEFLQFLHSHGLSAKGIDSNPLEVARAQAIGLDVECENAIDYLELHKECFSGISLLEVIEHLPPKQLPRLISMVYRALAPGAIAIFETINIKNSAAFNAFYIDPTHTRPIPSDLLGFMIQWEGFVDSKIIYTGPVARTLHEFQDKTKGYLVYAIIARKPTK